MPTGGEATFPTQDHGLHIHSSDQAVQWSARVHNNDYHNLKTK